MLLAARMVPELPLAAVAPAAFALLDPMNPVAEVGPDRFDDRMSVWIEVLQHRGCGEEFDKLLCAASISVVRRHSLAGKKCDFSVEGPLC